MAEASHAVFLSYASQDAEAARRICDALRAAGIVVFLDQSELRGGDTWDQSIREQLQACALFIPIISANAHSRTEGYFRLEWKLAVDRSHRMAPDQAFLLPVVIDDTPKTDKRIPERFRELQWSRLPGGDVPPAFVERVRRLLSPELSSALSTSRSIGAQPPSAATTVSERLRASWSRRAGPAIAAVTVLTALTYIVADRFWLSKRATTSATSASTAAAPATPASTGFSPPPHSIAVLPFVNMSGDKEQEYFSEGLTEEILNSLTKVNNLQVAARTSAFSFKGKEVKIDVIARELNVGAILEGSVRRSGNTVRITTQLINAVTGFHLWSETYDRDLGDVLKLQTEIAGAVASALKVSLLGEEAAKIESGGTRNPAAFDAYLRGRKAYERNDPTADQDAIAAYTEAIRLDPSYALAIADRSIASSDYAALFATGTAIREFFDKALVDARKALALAPELGEGQLALARFFDDTLDFARTSEAYERALTLAPGNAQGLRVSGIFSVYMGHIDPGLAALRRAVALDPLNPRTHDVLSHGLLHSRRYQEAVAAATDAISLDADYQSAHGYRGLAYYALGDFEHARASCEAKPDFWVSEQCLAVTYERLGRHAEAEAVLAKMRATWGDADAYQYATVYAQWGNTGKALEWLETAMRRRDPGLEHLKTDPLMDPLRKEPRFQVVMRELKFPD